MNGVLANSSPKELTIPKPAGEPEQEKSSDRTLHRVGNKSDPKEEESLTCFERKQSTRELMTISMAKNRRHKGVFDSDRDENKV